MSESAKIETTKAAKDTPAKKEKKVKVEKPLNVCWSGSGRLTRNRFAPGMDARFHGWAKKVARGELQFDSDTGVVSTNEGETISTLPHEDSINEFLAHVADERPKAKLRADEKVRKQAEIAARKAQREADKAKKAADKAAEQVEEDLEEIDEVA